VIGRREVMVAVRRGGEFLIVRRSADKGGYWHLVAGGVEEDEDWEAAARRELREETGFVAGELEAAGGFEYEREPWEPQPGMRVEARSFATEAPAGWEPELDAEHDEYRWCDREAAAELLYWPEPRDLVRGLP
jgi:8-oxo-dGTP pyrophosphatase MutT (NUDIX family)